MDAFLPFAGALLLVSIAAELAARLVPAILRARVARAGRTTIPQTHATAPSVPQHAEAPPVQGRLQKVVKHFSKPEKKMLEAKEVRERAEGRWLHIFAHLAPELSPAIKSRGHHVSCPVHGGKNGDGFRLFKDADQSGGGICNTCGAHPDGFRMLMWLKGWNFPTALEEVAGVLGIEGGSRRGDRSQAAPVQTVVVPEPDPALQAQEDQRKRDAMARTWAESTPLSDLVDGAPVFRYFARRGLDWTLWQGVTTLRQHPNLACYHKGKYLGSFPALVAIMYDATGQAVNIHRTYLTEDGHKAPVPKCKKQMALPSDMTVSGGAIRTAPPGKVLCVAEGIEDGLAVHMATKLPVWITPNAGLMEDFIIPETVELLVIFGNKDANQRGQEAARTLQQRAWTEGVRAQVLLPDLPIPHGESGVDWNDLLLERGPQAFPTVEAAGLVAGIRMSA